MTGHTAPRQIAPAVAALGDPRAAPDAGWVAKLLGAEPERVRAVLAELIAAAPLEKEIRRTLVGGGRSHYAQISGPFELYALTRILRPEHILEVGVSSGISSAHFLLALDRNRTGRLHSIDLPTHQRGFRHTPGESPVSLPPGRRSGWAVPASLRDGWDLRIGPSQRLLAPLIAELPRVDLFLHDDLHTPEHLAFELKTLRPRLRPGSVVLADNTSWTGDALDRFASELGGTISVRTGTDLAGFRVPAWAEPGPR
ncbi:MAG: class I SAM-dependent methyltransferase [Thermoplasmata archaeon]